MTPCDSRPIHLKLLKVSAQGFRTKILCIQLHVFDPRESGRTVHKSGALFFTNYILQVHVACQTNQGLHHAEMNGAGSASQSDAPSVQLFRPARSSGRVGWEPGLDARHAGFASAHRFIQLIRGGRRSVCWVRMIACSACEASMHAQCSLCGRPRWPLDLRNTQRSELVDAVR